MAVEFASLPDLWASLCDAVSGRPSVILDPPQTTNHWGQPATWYIGTVKASGEVTVTINLPGGADEDLVCPDPGDTMTEYRQMIAAANWRRSVLVSTDDGDNTPGSIGYLPKKSILEVVFPDIYRGFLNFTWNTGPELQTDFKLTVWSQFVLLFEGAVTITALGSVVDQFSPEANIAFDFSFLVFYHTSGFKFITPENPAEQLATAALIQFASGGDILTSSDALAIRVLAGAIANAGSRPGTVRQHGGRPLLSVGGPPPLVLPQWDGTTDTALRSIALASQGFFSQGLVLPLRGGRLAILGSGALL